MRSRFTLHTLWMTTSLVTLLAATTHAQWQPNGAVVCTAANDQVAPVVCPDGGGGAIVVWVDSRAVPFSFDLYAQRLNSIGQPQWAANGVAVCTAAGDQGNPSIIADGSGGAIVAWEDYRNGNGDVFAQRIDPAGAMLWTPDGVALCANIQAQVLPTLASDGAFGAIVAWEDFRTSSTDVYAQRVNAAGATQWTANGVAVCAADEDQFAPVLVADGAGGAILTWEDNRVFDFDIYAQRVNGAGAALWTTNGVGVCTAAGFELNPVLIANGSGGAIVAWEDLRETLFSFDIFAQRLSASGSAQWGLDGVGLCTDDADQGAVDITSDGVGGVIATWEDQRNGRGDIYAQRLSAAGMQRWTADGIAVCLAIGGQQAPHVVSDAANGAIVTWEDQRGSAFNTDLYGLRVDSTGTALWAADGIALTAAGSNQMNASLCPDGSGGAFLAWEDGRSGTTGDVYAQRVTGGGLVGPVLGVADGVPSSFSLLPPVPNPCRAGCTLRLALPRAQSVSADVLDPSGRRVRSLANGARLGAGTHEIAWDGRDEVGRSMVAGVYLVRVRVDGASDMRKVTVLP